MNVESITFSAKLNLIFLSNELKFGKKILEYITARNKISYQKSILLHFFKEDMTKKLFSH